MASRPKTEGLSADQVMAEAGLNAEAFHARSTIQEVKVNDLKIDRSYQRDLNTKVVEDIAADWNEVASELILVSDRGRGSEGGRYWVINGQHRTAAAKLINLADIWARVVRLDDLDDPGMIEADLRLRTNKRVTDRPAERFKAQLRKGDPESLAIQALLKRLDTEVNLVPTADKGINSVSTVEALYRWDGTGALLKDTVEVLKKSYGQIDPSIASSSMLKAVSWLLTKHNIDADVDRLVEKLGTIGISAIETRARLNKGTLGGAMWVNVYRVVLELYNERLNRANRLTFSLKGLKASQEPAFDPRGQD